MKLGLCRATIARSVAGLLFLLLFLTTGFAHAAESIVKNGGFETGLSPWWGAASNTVVTGSAAEGNRREQ